LDLLVYVVVPPYNGNYTTEPEAWPPAGTVTIGIVPDPCGDVRLNFTGLAAGLYTIVLSYALYYPDTVFETRPLTWKTDLPT
jgi:hypothetical protein